MGVTRRGLFQEVAVLVAAQRQQDQQRDPEAWPAHDAAQTRLIVPIAAGGSRAATLLRPRGPRARLAGSRGRRLAPRALSIAHELSLPNVRGNALEQYACNIRANASVRQDQWSRNHATFAAGLACIESVSRLLTAILLLRAFFRSEA